MYVFIAPKEKNQHFGNVLGSAFESSRIADPDGWMNAEHLLSPSRRQRKGFQETKDLREHQEQMYDDKTVILKAFLFCRFTSVENGTGCFGFWSCDTYKFPQMGMPYLYLIHSFIHTFILKYYLDNPKSVTMIIPLFFEI